MSDDPVKAIADAAPQLGWALAVLTGAWGFTLRFLIGRYVKQLDGVSAQLTAIELRLAQIEGRFVERDRHDETGSRYRYGRGLRDSRDSADEE